MCTWWKTSFFLKEKALIILKYTIVRLCQTSPTFSIDSENSIVNHSPKAFKNYEKLERKNFRQANRYEKWLLTVKDEITILKLNIILRHFVIVENPRKI